MDIVLIPGICFSRERRSKIISFVDNLEKNIDCQIDVLWFTKDQYKENQGLNGEGELKIRNKKERRFISELCFDIQYVVTNFDKIIVPKADIYIGHSAGSLLTMLCEKPCITMGNPASVLDMFWKSEEFEFLNKISETNNPILNIVNKMDIAAYPFQLPSTQVENFMFSTNRFVHSKDFVGIHESYYENKKVLKLIKEKLS